MRIIVLAWVVWVLSRQRFNAYADLATTKAPKPASDPNKTTISNSVQMPTIWGNVRDWLK